MLIPAVNPYLPLCIALGNILQLFNTFGFSDQLLGQVKKQIIFLFKQPKHFVSKCDVATYCQKEQELEVTVATKKKKSLIANLRINH